MAIIYPPSGGKIYGDTNVYPPSGGKIYPGTAYPSGVNPNWPFTDIPLPPFLWRPDLTGDYSNVGSDGAALNLTPAPGAPLGSFNQGWVIKNPSGESSVVSIPTSLDIDNLGGKFSLIFKFKGLTSTTLAYAQSSDGSITVSFFYVSGLPLLLRVQQDGSDVLSKNSTYTPVDGEKITAIVTFNAGVLHLYINGVEDTLVEKASSGTVIGIGNMDQGWWIGDDPYYPDDPSGDGSIIEVFSIVPETAYTPAQATEITAGLS